MSLPFFQIGEFAMMLPEYWLSRPAFHIERSTQVAFDHLLATARAHGAGSPIDYTLSAPKWQFLCYVADQHRIALHGSGNPRIAVFEPRQPVDLGEFGNQKAVYAAADGIWAMFFAIVDRDRYRMSLNNACIRLAEANGRVTDPFYVFSISQAALSQRPWRTGMVYLLPRDTFVEQPPIPFGQSEVQVAQLASRVPVTPLAQLQVAPHDFPFLAQIRGHDDARLQEYATAMQTGAPWPDDWFEQ